MPGNCAGCYGGSGVNGTARLALLQKVRADAASEGKALLRKAEERAAERAAEISANASREADGLRQMADKHMEAAAEFIVGRVVKD